MDIEKIAESSLVTLEVVDSSYPVMCPEDTRPYIKFRMAYRCSLCNTLSTKNDMFAHLIFKHNIPQSIIMLALDIPPIENKTAKTSEIA